MPIPAPVATTDAFVANSIVTSDVIQIGRGDKFLKSVQPQVGPAGTAMPHGRARCVAYLLWNAEQMGAARPIVPTPSNIAAVIWAGYLTRECPISFPEIPLDPNMGILLQVIGGSKAAAVAGTQATLNARFGASGGAPAPYNEQEDSGSGDLISLNAVGAAGSEGLLTFGAHTHAFIRAALGTLTTSAVAGVRTAEIIIQTPLGKDLFRSDPSTVTQAPSLTNRYELFPGFPLNDAALDVPGSRTVRLACGTLPFKVGSQFTVTTKTNNLDVAGDVWTIDALIEEWAALDG